MKFPLINKLISKLDHRYREIVRGASLAFVLKLLGAGMTFSFNVLLARLLGAEDTGIYTLAFTATTMATVFGRLGLEYSLVRFIAANVATGDWVQVKGVYQKGMRLAIAASAFSMVMMFVSAPWLSETILGQPKLTEPLRWMSLAVIPMTVYLLQAQVLKGFKLILESSMVEMVCVSTLSVIGLYLIGQQGGTNGAVWIYTAATAVTALAGVWALRIRVPQLRGVVGYFDTRELLRSSLPLFWFTVISQVVLWTPTFLLGIWGNAADVGIYNAAYKTSTVMIFASAATNSIVTPKFSAMFKQGDFDALGFLVRGCAKLTALLAAPISLIFILAPRSVMGIFGEQFIVGAPILTILTIGQFVEVATGAVGQLLIMTGHEKAIRNNIAITAVVNVLLCSVLIPAFGLTGAAIATTTSLTIMNCISVYLVWSNLKIWPLPFLARS